MTRKRAYRPGQIRDPSGRGGENCLSATTGKRKLKTMNFGEHARNAGHLFKALGLAATLAVMPQAVFAQEAAPAAPVAVATPTAAAAAGAADAAAKAADAAAPVAAATGSYVPMQPTQGVGMPVDGGIHLQTQFSPLGEYGSWIYNDVLTPIIFVITALVLGLLLFVMIRFTRRANPVPSKPSHHTTIGFRRRSSRSSRRANSRT